MCSAVEIMIIIITVISVVLSGSQWLPCPLAIWAFGPTDISGRFTVISVVLSGSPTDISGRFTVLDGRREVDGNFRLTLGQ